MKARWGDSIQVRYDLWVEGTEVRSNVESELVLCPVLIPPMLVDALLGIELNEERAVEMLCWQVVGHLDYPKDILGDTPISYRFTLTGVVPNPPKQPMITGGSVTARMQRVDPTLSKRYQQRSGEG